MKKILLALVVALCAVALGCNNGAPKPDDLPKLNPTTIKVVYDDGTPVTEAQVALRLPQPTGGRTWNLTGLTDSTGTLVLKTDGQWDGAPAGSYQVMVTKEVSDLDQGSSDTPGAGVTVKSITRYVNQKYNDPTTSGLTVEIKEGENAFELKVGEKVEEDVKVAG